MVEQVRNHPTSPPQSQRKILGIAKALFFDTLPAAVSRQHGKNQRLSNRLQPPITPSLRGKLNKSRSAKAMFIERARAWCVRDGAFHG